MTALADYSELVIAVGEYLDRADLVDVMPRFVAMAEAKLSRRLRDRRMLATTMLSPDAHGVCALPADFMEVEQVLAGTPPRAIEAAAGRYAARFAASGPAQVYTIAGSSLRLAPAAETPVALTYFGRLPALEAAQTNWLLEACPDIYLYAVVHEAAIYLSAAPVAEAAAGLLRDALDAAAQDNARARWSNAGFRTMEATP
ncbi:hypothetical protein BN1110_02380 [bacterium YEK0313]|nr:hypothetical protein BN1110_02380 [bacterium YEK0313]